MIKSRILDRLTSSGYTITDYPDRAQYKSQAVKSHNRKPDESVVPKAFV